MMTLGQRFQPHPQVVDTELEGQETVLLQMESTSCYSLNLTGTRIWQGLKQGQTLQEISRRLQAEFAVEEERADQSVVALVEELYHQQLVQLVD
jgi:hypothetical protein